jgi:hypothetical protein
MSDSTPVTTTKYLRTALVVLIVILSFVATYQIAVAAGRSTGDGAANTPGSGFRNACTMNGAQTPDGRRGPSGDPLALPDGATPGSGGCCGGVSGPPIEGEAALDGDVQRITVDTLGRYNPDSITLVAGVPAEITFKQASGCMAQVQSSDLGFFEDLTEGDVTVRLEADVLQPGTYSFSCGMQMVFGTIIVE